MSYAHEIQRNRWALGNEIVQGELSIVEQSAMIEAASDKIAELFDILAIDHSNDHNTRDTPRRVAKMLVNETLGGRYVTPPKITAFENVKNYDQLIVTGPIDLRSTCAHHFMPIYGSVYIGILPSSSGRIIGLSKYDRIVHHFASRLQIQEELSEQIGEFIVRETKPTGLAVRISATHMCKTHRGVFSQHHGKMVSHSFFGHLNTEGAHKQQFLAECLSLECSSSF